MAEDMGEKTELPTPRKLEEARERGQVAKSQDLAAAIDLIGGVLLLALFGGMLSQAMLTQMRRMLEGGWAWSLAHGRPDVGAMLRETFVPVGIACAPVLVLLIGFSVLSHFVQFGPLFSPKALEPRLDRLDPIKGAQNLLGRKNLVKAAFNLIKMIIIVWVGWTYMRGALDRVASLPVLGLHEGAAQIGLLCVQLAAWLLALLLVLAVMDYLFQRWQHQQELKMTRQEVQDERRSMEGDPLVKGRRLRMMRQIAMQRINSAVPQADVIVTNPTHFSVALKYDASSMAAPRVVAKGVDFMAMRIRQVGLIHKVPLVERPPLARALYAEVEVGQEVPAELYQAVAEVLAYVYRLEKEAA